jgi:tetraacyldisaccharide 4'-kinase
MKWLLWPLGIGFKVAVSVRRALYRAGRLASVRLPVPVIVVGNIAVGGTGKTPSVAWLARELRERGFSVGIISRGYGGRAKSWPQAVTDASDPREVGDEPVLLAQLAGCPVAVGPDRIAAGQQLLAEHAINVLVADDGLQHYRLGRQFEIAVVDGARGLGNGLPLPGGPLREPAQRLSEVDAVIVNGPGWAGQGAFRAKLEVTRVYQLAGVEERKLSDFSGTLVHAVAGVGNPGRFFSMLEAAGIIVDPRALPDHSDIDVSELEFDDDAPILITEKDAVKCAAPRADIWVIAVELRFDGDDGGRLMRRIVNALEAAVAS